MISEATYRPEVEKSDKPNIGVWVKSVRAFIV